MNPHRNWNYSSYYWTDYDDGDCYDDYDAVYEARLPFADGLIWLAFQHFLPAANGYIPDSSD